MTACCPFSTLAVCVGIEMLEDPRFSLCQDHKVFQYGAYDIVPKQDCYPIIKSLGIGPWPGILMDEIPFRHLFPK